jgi:NADH:ubiquinone oxidoreductase subunit 5 (subunit L)/multisubunit Na+/H+ antiporter MnhA subunit
MGIVGMGLGLGFLGLSWQNTDIALLGFCGAFLHLLNHATLKGGLFLAAGNVLKSSGILNMDQLGGLQKRLPETGACFTLSAIALSGMPPGNAFFGELLLYVAAGKGIASGNETMVAWSLAAMLTLALSGGLAATVFAKAVGAVFQGEPRSKVAREAAPLPRSMTLPLFSFLGLSILLVIASPFLALKMAKLFSGQTGLLWPAGMAPNSVCPEQIFSLLQMVSCSSLLLLILTFVLYGVRIYLLPRGNRQVRQGTWDCGFARPDARMQYTGTAFVQPLVDLFAGILRPVKNLLLPQGLFPKEGEVEITCKDGGEQMFWKPLVDWTVKIAIFTHRLQSGHLHLYILFMVIALLAMLVWGFAG